MNDSIRCRRYPLPAGGYLMQLTLDSPRSLNALNLEMMQALLQHLREAAADGEAVAVFLDGEGERAFSAGGDVRRMRESALGNPGGRAREAERFFETEYRRICGSIGSRSTNSAAATVPMSSPRLWAACAATIPGSPPPATAFARVRRAPPSLSFDSLRKAGRCRCARPFKWKWWSPPIGCAIRIFWRA